MLIVSIHTTQAALLKDIRIGEHDTFTRIVLELDSPTEPDQITPISSDRLAVVFANTSAEFIRKIPVERSRHIKGISIWDKSNQLSAVFSFDFKYFRHESFSLMNPPRIVLDIKPLENAPQTVAATTRAEPKATGEKLAQAAESATPESSSIEMRESSLPENEMNPAGAGSEPNNSSPSLAVSPKIPETRSSVPDYRGGKNDEQPTDSTFPGHQQPAKPSSRLQFYLVVVLVLITIVILALLLLMLLFRHRWADGNPHVKPEEFFKTQDMHIASLDARIKEQLKR